MTADIRDFVLNPKPNDGILAQDCDCLCDHTKRCEDGCNPADANVPVEWSEWTCIGGTRYKLYDTRED
jgi:hypothetical protein